MHSDAGTNRTNAVSRDNLMNGAGLGYDGYYLQVALYRIGLAGLWWSSTIRSTSNTYYLGTNSDQDSISPQNIADKYTGRAMRYRNAERTHRAYYWCLP
ncbi:hypothetical protein IKE88_01360 [Candidatus Saccharibacteria bacterium]|nr:hypothetical protein [Candidatus Saccharibacteria bacterium]